MSARAGVFVKVVKRVELGNPGKGGAVALLLQCGHARTGYRSTKSKRLWCRICTKAAKRTAKPTSYTQAQLDRAVAKAVKVARSLRAKTTKTSRAAAKVPRLVTVPQTQAERDRLALLVKFPS